MDTGIDHNFTTMATAPWNFTTLPIETSNFSTDAMTNLVSTSWPGFMNISRQQIYYEILNSINASVLCEHSVKDAFTPSETQFCMSIALYVILSLLSGLYSTLITSFFSLDLTRLELCIRQGTPRERLHAYRVIPLLKSPHMLLVTLNLGNVASILSLPVLLNFILRPLYSILLSAFVVLIFNKVLPQVIGDRHGLFLAGIMTWFVYLSMFLFFLAAWPIATFLSCWLGTRKERFYQRSELIALMELQMTSPDAAAEKKNLSPDEVFLIKGALDAGSKTAVDAMIPIDELSRENLTGDYSQMASHSDQNGNTQEHLPHTSLIRNAPRVTEMLMDSSDSRNHPLQSVPSDTPLYDILDDMNVGCYTVAAVYNNETGVLVGILTLQNVLDVILGQSRSSVRDSRRTTLRKLKLVQSRRQQLAIERRRSLPEHVFKYVNVRMPDQNPLIT